ncbi:endoglucanase-1 [Magnaporthiopsis poae ATCC 64411]|uniref:Endoglucanase-1 n=1 Tax=Magnaporthiopsis poae (strain ATCC 64411 / 73-15) TaxID=644358 RepID=A0A0C4DQ74_MAGP6|nr:endoglucanase-1 [Magnaporthiopsis poae ATCC 64411]
MKATTALLFLGSLVSAAPAGTSAVTPLEGRQLKTLCDQYGYWSGNGFEINNNMWGKSSGSGSQCTYVDTSSSQHVSFRTNWQWSGGQNNVKSYPYVGRQIQRGRTIASINSMPTNVQWNYNNGNIRANVAYDLFTSTDANHDNTRGDYELMVWLGRYGDIQPIGSQIGTANVAGRNWQLWTGMNGNMRVYSFVTTQGAIGSFNADIKAFFNYLQQNQGFPASRQYLTTFQFGSEPFTGGPTTFQVNTWNGNIQ